MDAETKAKLVELMNTYEQKDKDLLQKKLEVEQALGARSKVVDDIGKLINPSKSVMYKGKQMSIVRRGDTVFFKAPKGSVVEVD